MKTDNKEIATAEYWRKIYAGENMNAKVDSSNTPIPKKRFDRFTWVANHAEGTQVLGIASGHAHIEKIIKSKHPDWTVFATDQTDAAKKAANYYPYNIVDAYHIGGPNKVWDTLIVTQALEYMEFQDKALKEFKRVARYFLCTIPIGEMKLWSQLHIYTEDKFRKFISKYGTIEVWEREGDLLLVKLKLND